MMNRIFFVLMIGLLGFTTTQAQEDPAKALKKAGTAMATYNLDPTNNLPKLQEAVSMIDIATSDATVAADPAAWQTRGDVYNAIANQMVTITQLGVGSLDDLPKVEYPALEALAAYQKAHSMSIKKFQIKDALKGLRSVQTSLNSLGIGAFEAGMFDKAYDHFNGVLAAHEVLAAASEASMLEGQEAMDDQFYITGLAALNANNVEAAAPLFKKLQASGADKPAIYESLYKIEAAAAFDPASTLSNEEQNMLLEKAYPTLAEGRTKYPDDISLLFAEINHFLRINKLDELIGKLEAAIAKEPDNVSLYTTMGSVYDNLFQREFQASNNDKANEYFNKALEYFNRALAKDAGNNEATYSIGALYFNRGANKSQALTALADDLSREGQRKYEALQTEIKGDFELALPYFIEVEKKNPNDLNTLIALKEIYARKNEYALSNEFKGRVERVNNGETVTSYFANK